MPVALAQVTPLISLFLDVPFSLLFLRTPFPSLFYTHSSLLHCHQTNSHLNSSLTSPYLLHDTPTATNIIYGLALGYLSCIPPAYILAACIYVSFELCDLYGVALAAGDHQNTLSYYQHILSLLTHSLLPTHLPLSYQHPLLSHTHHITTSCSGYVSQSLHLSDHRLLRACL